VFVVLFPLINFDLSSPTYFFVETVVFGVFEYLEYVVIVVEYPLKWTNIRHLRQGVVDCNFMSQLFQQLVLLTHFFGLHFYGHSFVFALPIRSKNSAEFAFAEWIPVRIVFEVFDGDVAEEFCEVAELYIFF